MNKTISTTHSLNTFVIQRLNERQVFINLYIDYTYGVYYRNHPLITSEMTKSLKFIAFNAIKCKTFKI